MWAAFSAMCAAAAHAASPSVTVEFEVARRPLGTYTLHAPSAPAELSGPTLGPLSDPDGVPFRTWTTLLFSRAPLRLLNGTYGVGYTLRLRWPDLPTEAPPTALGANGALAFEGTLTVRCAGTEESAPVRWSRGFEARPDDATRHVEALQLSSQVHETGQLGPYQWTLTGTLSTDLHLWAP
jgi:hypothetical protein